MNPTPKQAGAGTESPSDLPSHLDYPIILEQPTLEEGKNCCILENDACHSLSFGKSLHAYAPINVFSPEGERWDCHGELDNFEKLGSNSPHLGKYVVSEIP